MELEIPNNGDPSDLQSTFNGGEPAELGNPFAEDFDSTCSTPFVSAPSSPGRGPAAAGGYFFSAPTSPMHYVLSSSLATAGDPFSATAGDSPSDASLASGGGSFEFDFSARFSPSAPSRSPGAASMTSADELFLNGQIRPMRLSSHLLRPQPPLAPLLDLSAAAGGEGYAAGELDAPETCFRGRDLRLRSRSVHRRARSHSPLRNSPFHWRIEVGGGEETKDLEPNPKAEISTPPVSASSSRSSSTSSSSSSSSGRRSKKWIFLKDLLLHRSKSEGRRNPKEHFWHHISLSSSKEKEKEKEKALKDSKLPPPPAAATVSESERPRARKPPAAATGIPVAARGRRRGPAPSPHERHYTANRAQADEMRRRTFLPYRQGLLGCLGFSSRSYGAINGFAKSLNPVSSRHSKERQFLCPPCFRARYAESLTVKRALN